MVYIYVYTYFVVYQYTLFLFLFKFWLSLVPHYKSNSIIIFNLLLGLFGDVSWCSIIVEIKAKYNTF